MLSNALLTQNEINILLGEMLERSAVGADDFVHEERFLLLELADFLLYGRSSV